MASPELQTVLDMLRGGDTLAGDTILEQRANLEASTAGTPAPEGVDVERVDAGGVAAEWTRGTGAAVDRAIVSTLR